METSLDLLIIEALNTDLDLFLKWKKYILSQIDNNLDILNDNTISDKKDIYDKLNTLNLMIEDINSNIERIDDEIKNFTKYLYK